MGVVFHRTQVIILVDPKATLAEIYELENSHYKLKAELKDESFEFDIGECSLSISFKEVFE